MIKQLVGYFHFKIYRHKSTDLEAFEIRISLPGGILGPTLKSWRWVVTPEGTVLLNIWANNESLWGHL